MTPQKIAAFLDYELVRVIARGGMGAVYEAVQHGTDNFCKTVALKVIREEYSAIKEFRSNFIGEAKLVADLIHTNIVQTYHLGQVDNKYYMVMEYVNGVNLEEFFLQHVKTEQLVPVDLGVFLVSRVCRGLSYAHQKTDKNGRALGIVHRDVNPKNIMISFEGDVKLTDFGIAKALDLMYNKEGEVIAGKDEYLSPEQVRKEITDPRADLFSCGIVMSELLLGYNIFEGESVEETHNNILNGRLPDFRELDRRIDSRLNTILHRALEKDISKRYQNAYEMLTELEMYLYSDGYGPTNEKLALYVKDIYSNNARSAGDRWNRGVRDSLTKPGLV